MNVVPEKCVFNQLVCPIPDSGFLALPRSGDIEAFNPMLGDKSLEQEGWLVAGGERRDMEAWFFVLSGKIDRAE